MTLSDNAENKIIQLLQQIVFGRSAPPSQPWTSYGGINNSGPITLVGQARQQVTNFLGSLGPLGQLAGPYIADYLVGTDFNRNGTLNNPLSGLLAPSSGTYAGAYQRMARQQVLEAMKQDRDKVADALRKQFYTNYYKMTMGSGATSDAIKEQVAAAMKNMVSLPAALQFVFDPANNTRILQGIKNTQAGYLYWQDRLAPGKTSFDSSVAGARAIGAKLAEMAGQANRMQIEGSAGGWKGSYGGFTGAQVAQLTSILANASNVFGSDTTKEKLDEALQKLQNRVKGLTQALAPLKDIFGTDIKAMVDMLQSVSGQNINQLPVSMVDSIAKSTVDMARYSGATVTQIAQAGQRIFMQSAQMGGTSFSRIGANFTGSTYAALMARGNTPAGVHAAEYSGFAQRTLASAQASAGVDWTAMAYGLWAEKKGNEGKSIDDFMAQVRSIRNTKGGTLMQAVIKAAGASNQQDLLRGRATIGYRTSLQSGRLAQLGVQGQYYTQLGDAIAAMKQQNPGFGAAWDKLGQFMAKDANAALIKELAANGNDKDVVSRFAKAAGVSQAVVNTFLNTANMQSYMAAWGSSMEATAYSKSQDEIRKATEDLQGSGAGGLLAFWKAASTADFKSGGKLKLQNGKTINDVAVLAQGRAVLGATNVEDMRARLARVKKALGEDRAAEYLALAGGEFAKDAEYLAALKRVAGDDYKGKDDEKAAAKKTDLGYLEARRLGFLGANTQFKSQAAKKARDEALADFQGKGESQQAKKALQKGMTRALRLQNLANMSALQLGLTGPDAEQKRKKLLEQLTKNEELDLANLTDDQLKALGLNKKQAEALAQTTGTNYNNQVDVNRMLMTALSMLIKWLQQHPNKEGEL